MKQVFRRIFLSLALLAATAMTLLLSDLHSREGARDTRKPGQTKIPVAILKHITNTLLDDTERGVLKRLAADGYEDGGRIALQRFSAEGDLPTANAIAQRITDGSFKMVISISTLSLQCVANANKDGRAIHVFGAVTDPVSAGVGIQQMGTTNKPPWMAGIGTFQPVELIFREVKRLWPELKVVGVVWNPAERNSEVCTVKAREICRELGMEMIEANVDQSKDVREAADSLVARGAQAFWTGADVTVINAINALCEAAKRAKIPVFSNTAGNVREGTLFDLGADYYEVGEQVGDIAASILDGRNPATMVVSNFMPERVMLNKQVLKNLRDPWSFPEDLIARASLIIGEDGRVEKDVSTPASNNVMRELRAVASRTRRPFRIGIAYFGPDVGADSAIAGLMDGLRKLGLAEGRNLMVTKVHANGQISGIPAMLQSLDASDVDAIVTLSSPVLTAACATVQRKPVVFTFCFDPIAAGAGKSFEDHLPFVTGVGSFPPVGDAVAMLKLTFPRFKKLGTLYNNAEANSEKAVSVLRELCRTNGIELVEAGANNTSEVVQAAQSLAARGAEVVYVPGDNTVNQAFDGLAGQLAAARLPLVVGSPMFAHRGVLAVVGVSYYQSGFATAEPLARVLAGEKPGTIPIRNVSEKQVILDQNVARRLGVTFPPAVLAAQTTETAPATKPAVLAMQTTETAEPPTMETVPQPLTKQWRIQQVSYMESVMVEDAMRGFKEGLKEAGLREGTDFTMRTLCAQGDMATLGPLFDSAETAGVDLYMVYSTPTLQTALQKVRSTPVLFTVVADPFVAGAGKTDDDHLPNVTGVYTLGPYREMAEMLRTNSPQIKRVGTLFCPAEANSVVNKDTFVREATRCGISVETVPANTASELSDAALALCSRRIDAIVQVIDNLSASGFPTITHAAAQARLPVFACQGTAVTQGAAVALTRDYYDAGRETALKAARIMRGENPAQIPFSPPRTVRILVNLKNARAAHLTLPEALLRQAQQVTDATPP